MSQSYQDPERIVDLAERDYDALPFGAIKLDPDATVLQYNAYEAEAGGT